MSSNKRRASFLLVSLALLLISSPFLLQRSLHWYVQIKAQQAGYHLKYQSLKLSLQGITLKQVVLEPEEKTFSLQIPSLYVRFLGYLPFQGKIQLALEKPHLCWKSKKMAFSSSSSFSGMLAPLEGTLDVYDPEENFYPIQNAFFSYENQQWKLLLPEGEEAYGKIKPEGYMEACIQEGSLEKWQDLIQYFYPLPYSLKGDILGLCFFKQQGATYLKAEIHQLQAISKKEVFHIEKSCLEMQWDASEVAPCFFREFLLPQIGPWQIGLHAKNITCLSGETLLLQQGELHFSNHPQVGSKLFFTGHSSENTPLYLEGKAFFFSKNQDWMTLKISLGEQEKLIHIQGKEKDKNMDFSIQVPMLSNRSWNQLKYIASRCLPVDPTMDWEIEKAGGNLKMEMTPQEKKIWIEDWNMQGVTWQLGSLYQAGIEKASLQAEVSFKENRGYFHEAKSYLQNAYYTFSSPQLSLQKIQGEVHVKDHAFLPSSFDLSLNGMQSQCSLKGALDQLQLWIYMQGDSHLLWDLFPPSFSLKKLASTPFSLKSFVYVQDQKIHSSSQLFLEGKEQTEPLHLTGTFPWEKLWEEKNFSQGEGWLLAKNFELAGLDPLWEEPLSLEGKADFLLAYQEKKSTLTGCGNPLFWKNQEFHFKLDTGQTPFHLSWEEGKIGWQGDFVLANAALYLPKKDLWFTQLKGSLQKRDDLLHLSLQQAASEGVSLQAEAYFTLLPEDLLLDIQAKQIQGDLPSIVSFSSHFLGHLPHFSQLQGNFQGKDLYIKGYLYKEVPTLWSLEADILEGSFSFAKGGKIEKLKGHISKGLQEELKFWDLSSELLFPGQEKKWQFRSPYFEWGEEKYAFDICLEEKIYELVRLKGEAHREKEEILFCLDSAYSHLLGNPLLLPTGCLDSSGRCKKVKLSSEIELALLLKHGKFFAQQIIPPQSWEWLEKIQGKVSYELVIGEKSALSLVSPHIKWGEALATPLEAFFFKEAKGWEIKTLKLGELQAQGHLDLLEADKKTISFQMSQKDCFSLKGDLSFNEQQKLAGNIQHLWLDIQAFPYYSGAFRGEIEASGCFFLDISHLDRPDSWQVDLDIKPQKIHWKHLTFYNDQKSYFHYSQKEGAMLKGLNWKLFSPDVDLSSLFFRVDTLYFQDQWFLKQAQVFVSGDLFAFLEKSFPSLEAFFPRQWFQEVKELQKDLQWTGDLWISTKGNTLFLDLQELSLPLGEYSCYVKDLYLKSDINSCQLEGKYLHENKPYEFQIFCEFSSPFKGKVVLLDEKTNPNPFSLSWSWEKGGSLRIHELQGNFLGMEASLFEESFTPEGGSLLGSVYFNFSKILPLLQETYKPWVQNLQLGEGYELKGHFSYGKNQNAFQGILSGKEFEIGGFSFKTLLAKMYWSKDRLELKDVKLSDSSGVLKIDSFSMRNTSLGRILFVPKIQIKEFRPSLMKKIGKEAEDMKPFLIRNFVLENVQGCLEDPESFTAKGSLHFINSFKREHTFFDLPSEVLGRIFGLDLELLIPVTGKMEVELKQGKLFFTSLTEAFSENHRSKFFLAEPEMPSFIDLQGNLHIYVKMKQYVLFKFTENFILKVEGKLNDPTFSLNRKKSFFSS